MEAYTTIVTFFQSGGFFMYPIMLVLACGLAIAIERFIYLNKAKRKNLVLWKELQPIISANRYRDAFAIASESKADIAKMLSNGLIRAHNKSKLSEIETAMDEGLMEAVPRLEKRTHYLSTFANIATLLGLLGTIIGLIEAFTAVSNADPAEKADLLSASISVAMNTTAFGLMVAIPLLLIFTVMQTKTNEIIDGLEMISVKFLNLVTAHPSQSTPPLQSAQAPQPAQPSSAQVSSSIPDLSGQEATRQTLFTSQTLSQQERKKLDN